MPMLEIGSSKQLFFDDYLIESLTRATFPVSETPAQLTVG